MFSGDRVKWAEGNEGVDGDRDTLIGARRLTPRDCTALHCTVMYFTVGTSLQS